MQLKEKEGKRERERERERTISFAAILFFLSPRLCVCVLLVTKHTCSARERNSWVNLTVNLIPPSDCNIDRVPWPAKQGLSYCLAMTRVVLSSALDGTGFAFLLKWFFISKSPVWPVVVLQFLRWSICFIQPLLTTFSMANIRSITSICRLGHSWSCWNETEPVSLPESSGWILYLVALNYGYIRDWLIIGCCSCWVGNCRH